MKQVSYSGYQDFVAIAFVSLIVFATGCAIAPDNWAFTKEIIKTERLSKIKRIALLDVPPPTNIVLGDRFSDTAVDWLGLVGMFTVEDTEGKKIVSGNLISETTQTELKKWLEQSGIEVVQIEAERKNKSKMLKTYEQFSEVDADAILEVAPVEVGFKYQIGKVVFRKSKQDLSPDIFFKFRLVSTKTGEVLVESNVTYSSFTHYHGLAKGVNLIGPEEHILDDEDFVKENPEEAVRRLKYAITGASESIAQVVTNTREPVTFFKKSQPISGSSDEIDLSGMYQARVQYRHGGDYWCFLQRKKFLIKVEQEQNRVKGEFLVANSAFGNFEGEIDGGIFEGFWSTIKCAIPHAFKLLPDSDGLSLQSSGSRDLTWQLQKL